MEPIQYDVTEILSDLGINYRLEGSPRKINGFSSIEEATDHDLSFCSYKGVEAISSISKSAAALILCNSSMQGAIWPTAGRGLIFIADPRIDFIKIVNYLQKKEKVSAISQHAVISKNAKIGPNCQIGAFTLIGDKTKIDALVSIAHNVQVGKRCLVTEGAIIGGSVKIGDECWLGLNSTIKQKVKIGNNVLVAAGACVLHDVPDEDIVGGVPAKSIKDKVSSDRLFMMAG